MREENMELEMAERELPCRRDPHDTFHGKATVERTADGMEALKSYGEPVALYSEGDGRVYLLDGWDKSNTTMRHVREFIRQKTKLNVPRADSIRRAAIKGMQVVDATSGGIEVGKRGKTIAEGETR